jgi:hypothetical protein
MARLAKGWLVRVVETDQEILNDPDIDLEYGEKGRVVGRVNFKHELTKKKSWLYLVSFPHKYVWLYDYQIIRESEWKDNYDRED